MSIAKKSIALLIVPAFAMATVVGCAQQDSGVSSASEDVVKTADGSYVQVAEGLNKSYEEAKAKGYTGTYEEWVKLLELHQSNPQQAAQQAKDSGFDGMDMLMAGAMGMMLGNMMSNGSYNSYRERQRSYGSSAYAPASTTHLNQARASHNSAVQSHRAAAAKASSASRSSSATARGGFGGASSTGG